MKKTVREKSAARQLAASARQKPASRGRPEDRGGDPHTKGAMREPAQTPDGQRGAWARSRRRWKTLKRKRGIGPRADDGADPDSFMALGSTRVSVFNPGAVRPLEFDAAASTAEGYA